MKRANLNEDEVTRIIIMSTMTMQDTGALADLIAQRSASGGLDLGCHYYICGDGEVLRPVSCEQRGDFIPRYGRTSIVIVLEGGLDEEGKPTKYYSTDQLVALQTIVRHMGSLYPMAQPTFYRELFRGINPVIEHEDYLNA